jgi:hypothetical protein
MKREIILIITTSLFALQSRAQNSTAGEATGWTEMMKSGTWTAATLGEKESLLKKLDESIAKSGTKHNIDILKRSSRRAHSALRVQRHLDGCVLENEKFRSLSKGLMAGAHQALDCSPNETTFDQAKSVVQSAQEANLLQVAQVQALANLSVISKEAEKLQPAAVAGEMNLQLTALSASKAELLRELNRSVEKAKTRDEAEKLSEQALKERGVPYRADYANLLRAPWRSVLFTETLALKVGSEISLGDLVISSQRAGPGALKFQVALPEQAAKVETKDVQLALTEQKKKLKDAYKSLRAGSVDLDLLLTQFPVSLGQALALSDSSDETLRGLCAKLQGLEKNEKWRKGAWQALDLGLTATALVGGVGGLGLKFAGKNLLSRAMGMGAASAAAGQSTSEMMHAMEASQTSDLALQFAGANPSLARDPTELKRLNEALNEFSRAKNDVILNGSMSAAGAGAYLAATRHLSSGTKTADEILEAAKNLRKPASEDKSFARSLSKLMSCR